MKIINVEFKGIKVASFSPARQDVRFAIAFDDGKAKEVTKTIGLKKGSDAALDIIRDIRRVENSLNAEFDGKTLLDSYVNIIITDEEKITERLTVFLSKVFEKVKLIKSQTVADGYIGLINRVNSMKLEF